MTFGEKLKQIRVEKDWSQEELADFLGTSKQVISRYETNQRAPKVTVAQNFSEKLGIPLSLMLDESVECLPKNLEPLPKMYKVPIIGTIACGTPILAEENIEDYVDVPENIRANFSLRCEGDSMIGARIQDGDIVFIRKQDDVEDGQIAAVLIEDEATLKRVYHNRKGGNLISVTLVAENPLFPPMTFTESDMVNIRIIGKAVAFISNVK